MAFAENKGVRIHYEVQGSGPTLVLLHGTTGSLEGWRELGYAEALEARHRLILVDLRGHGGSDKPHEVEAYDWPLLVEDVVSVLDQLGVSAADVMGYSAGSYVALGMAMSTPDRVRSLILGGASPRWTGGPSRLRDLLAEGMEPFLKSTFGAAWPLPAQQLEKLLANDAAAIRASLGAPRCTPSPEMLGAFTKPCLIFVGENDFRLADSREMATHFSAARLVTFPGLDHAQTMLRSDLVLPHLREFLDAVPA
jgi:pimeloyl-ACP methyl ester carboxylesterase